MNEAIAALLARLARSREWPTDDERRVRGLVNRWAAFAYSEEYELRRLAGWPATRPYVIDNLPEKIKDAYADLLVGEDPRVTVPDDADAARYAAMLGFGAGAAAIGGAARSQVGGSLHAAVGEEVSEGETWWRLCIDPATSSNAIITWHSRADVVPLLNGRQVAAVAFVSMLSAPTAQDVDQVADADHPGRPCWRHLEVHAAGTIENHLFKGSWTKLGDAVELKRHPETEYLPEAWPHGLPMLAGRISNGWGRRPLVGVSDYAGVWTRFLVLNEAVTIGRENLRLTAKRRVVVPGSAVRQRPGATGLPSANAPGPDPEAAERASFDAGEDVIVHDPLDTDDSGGQGPFKVLEYTFDAEALIAYQEHEATTILTRCNIVPQFVGSGDFGLGASGTALRVRLLPTVNAAEGKARPWDATLPHIFSLAARLEALPQAQGGLAVPWAQPQELPAVERTNPLPEDPNEIAQRQATLRTADLVSIETALRERYPDRQDDWILDEVARIRSDQRATVPFATPFGGTEPPPEDQGTTT